MRTSYTALGIGLAAAGCLTLGACATTQKHAESKSSASMYQITALYKKATAHHRRAVRKPIRDSRARALRMLASEAEQLVAETEAWESSAKLTSEDDAQNDEVRATVASFRASLRKLRDAAKRADVSNVRLHHQTASASYRRLKEISDVAR